ncbi:glycosyltransferase [Aliarcobacter cryaerophilus]|uniref:glycosyltransferase n=1 Tax=Aliarcobacter cryaerophilus TaxID=28198 RepID=UPI0021B5395F|nr:glycosyltransferase [Aliarcobacter cryaerophilus]MCT7492526.1 glycosyltransferase [Aliarcobacter cryaerophilus]
MKIVYISNSIIPSRAANSIHVMKMCQAFAENGHEVVLLAPNRYKEYEKGVEDVYEYYGVKNNFKIKKLWYPNSKYLKGKDLFYGVGIFLYLFFHKPTLSYSRFTTGSLFSILAKVPSIYESHVPAWYSHKNERFSFNLIKRMSNLIKIVVISEALKSIYQKSKILPENLMIEVEHDGTDIYESIENMNFSGKNTFNIGYIGHLYKGRGIDIIIECAKVLKNVNFHIIGGTEKDILYWKKQVNLPNLLFYGFMQPSKVAAYRNSFDILLAPYQKEVNVSGNDNISTAEYMSPLKIFEYMGSKKPIICSDLPVIREVLNDLNSKLVSPDNIEEWICAIQDLKSNHKLRDNLAMQAFADVQKHTWLQRAKNLLTGITK